MDDKENLAPSETDIKEDSKLAALEQTVDRVLGKYVAVWIWSVLLGTNIGLAYSFIGYRPSDRWGMLTILLVLLLTIGSLAALMSLIYLFQYLSRFLIPVFYYRVDDMLEVELDQLAAKLLKRSVSSIIVAVLVRGILTIVELLYASVRV